MAIKTQASSFNVGGTMRISASKFETHGGLFNAGTMYFINAHYIKINGGTLAARNEIKFNVPNEVVFICQNGAKISAPDIYFSCEESAINLGDCTIDGALHFEHYMPKDEL